MKLMVLDGNSLVNRAYYGIRPLTTREGLYTHAVFGFVTTLQRLLEEEKPDALCVTFDRREPTFRHLCSRRCWTPWPSPATSWRATRRTI